MVAHAGLAMALPIAGALAAEADSYPEGHPSDVSAPQQPHRISTMLRLGSRFSPNFPSCATLGDDMRIRILYPFDKLKAIYAIQAVDDAEIEDRNSPARLEPTKDGQANAIVPALIPGNTQFNVIAVFQDGKIFNGHFWVKVGPPVLQPIEFHVDYAALATS